MKHRLTKSFIEKLTPTNKPQKIWDEHTPGLFIHLAESGRKTFYLHYRNELGKSREYRIGRFPSLTLSNARDKAVQLLGSIARGCDPHAERKEARAKATTKQAEVLIFKTYLETYYFPYYDGRYPDSAYDARRTLNVDFAFLADKALPDITTLEISQWVNEAIKAGLENETINRRLATLSGAFSRAVEWECVQSSPVKSIKALPTDTNKDKPCLMPDIESKLRLALRERNQKIVKGRDKANKRRQKANKPLLPYLGSVEYADHLEPMVLLMLTLGLRISEILKLKWSDVDFIAGQVTLQGDEVKSGRTRRVPFGLNFGHSDDVVTAVGHEAGKVLKAWHKQTMAFKFVNSDGLVFVNPDTGKKFTDVTKAYAPVTEKAGAPNGFHALRHTYASSLLWAKIDVNRIQDLMGHSTLETTKIYLHNLNEMSAHKTRKFICDESNHSNLDRQMKLEVV